MVARAKENPFSRDRIDELFGYERHQYGPIRDLAYEYYSLAVILRERLPDDPETDEALRELLISKDCAVRGLIQGIRQRSQF